MEEEKPAPADKPLAEDEVRITGATGSQVFKLRAVASLAVRYEVKYAIADNAQRAGAAALGICVSKIGHAVGRYDYNPLEYGGRVIEWLLAQGVAYIDIYAAGRRAWVHLCRDLPTAAEVKETEDFFGAKAGDSTSR